MPPTLGEAIGTEPIMAGISLVIDVVDVVRYLVGGGALLHRWG